jgi:hypothetical protein
MEAINEGFADATVITHLAKIHKEKVNDLTIENFLISQYTDKQLVKYFKENINRTKSIFISIDSGNHPERWSTTKTFIIGFRDCSAGHMPYSKNCNTYKWNVEKSITSDWIIENCNYYAKSGRGFRTPYIAYTFNTKLEYDNFIMFFYSQVGFKFISKIMTALNTLTNVDANIWLPKVDWTRSWTVEEILRDYGYTEEEITEVMADLDNFKGMDD